MNWKTDLEKVLNDLGRYRYEVLDKQLESCLKDWKNLIDEFYQMTAKYEDRKKPGEDNNQRLGGWKYVAVDVGGMGPIPFQSYLIHELNQEGEMTLRIKSTVGTKPEALLRHKDYEEFDRFIWEEDILRIDNSNQQEIILQTLNIRLRNYYTN